MSASTPEKPIVIGLTGNIATGKSTVSAYLRNKGAYVIDADRVAHHVIEPGTEAYRAVVADFGACILAPDQKIDRGKLGAIVFSDARKMKRLEQIIHPAVFQEVYNQIKQVAPPIVIIEAIKLLETNGLRSICDEVWVVVADSAQQLRRTKENRGMSEQETLLRMEMQSPQETKIEQADIVIYNNSSLADLYNELDRIWTKFQQRYAVRLRNLADQT